MNVSDERQPLLGRELPKRPCPRIPQRLVLAIMGFLAITNAYTMRICLNIAITKMVVPKNDTGLIQDGFCPRDEAESPSSHETGDGGSFEWSEALQGIILSAFYWGYVVTHVPGGLLAERFGGKWCLSLGILSTSLFTLATPLVVSLAGKDSAAVLIGLRFLEGMGEGTTFPALSALLANWVPLQERCMMGSLVFGGSQIGVVLGNSISGLLLANFHWSSVFYFFGLMGLLWFVVFSLLCFSSPETHPFISPEEKEFLREQIGRLERDKDLPATPWGMIFTNSAVLALIIAQIGHDWGFFVIVTDLPKYMHDVLHFSIKENGFYSSLPYVIMWLVSVSSGILGDWMIKRQMISTTNSRKLFTAVAAIGPAIFIMLASYAGCSKSMTILHFTLAMGLMGTYYAGMKVNILDLSPNYSGSLMAAVNGIGAITGIFAPAVIGFMTPNHSLFEWRLAFWVGFVIFLLTTLIYVIWASGEVQDFNDPKKEEQANKTQ